MTQAPRHSVSVAAVVTDDRDRVLVIQRRDNGAWQLPGGVLELDESPAAGCGARFGRRPAWTWRRSA